MRVFAVDPGKRGYCCFLDNFTANSLQNPYFWPAPVTHGEDDEKAEYDIPKLVDIVWKCCGVKESNPYSADLIIIEKQAPRRHGSGKFGQGKEGTISSFTAGFGFGLWLGAMQARGQKVQIVEPLKWKRDMGVLASHSGADTQYARRKAADAKSIEVAQRLGPEIDFRPLERSPKAKTPSPDKAVSYLLARYGLEMKK